MLANETAALELIAQKQSQFKGKVPSEVVEAGERLLKSAKNLDRLEQFAMDAEEYIGYEPGKPVQATKPKHRKSQMLAQNHFSADGPAIWMSRGKRVQVTLQGHTTKMRLWDQPVEVPDKPSLRVLRLRKGAVPRITSKPVKVA